MSITISDQKNVFKIICALTAASVKFLGTMQRVFDESHLGSVPRLQNDPVWTFSLAGRQIKVVQQPVLVDDAIVGLMQFYSCHPITEEVTLQTQLHIDQLGNVKHEWSRLAISNESFSEVAAFVSRLTEKLVGIH